MYLELKLKLGFACFETLDNSWIDYPTNNAFDSWSVDSPTEIILGTLSTFGTSLHDPGVNFGG
jgi:hypothetical protein